MKIIQSFAEFKEGNNYVSYGDNSEIVYLTFYSALLSYITIKNLYGHVTKYCNQKAYDSFIKYIPYDEVIIMENENDFRYWSLYKLDSIRNCDGDVIHIDSDVFFFNDLLRDFINGKDDVIVQDILSERPNIISDFMYANLDYFNQTGIYTKEFKGESISGGVMGMRNHVKDTYFKVVDDLKKELDNNNLKDIKYPTTILDEQAFYLVIAEHGLSVNEVIPRNIIDEHGIEEAGNIMGYVHMWQNTKYQPDNIKHIKEKILYDYPEYNRYLINYESNVMMKTNIFYGLGLG